MMALKLGVIEVARKVRVGIDVGGTFTHAIALDAETCTLMHDVKILTTHDAPEGVARGVVDALQRLLSESGISPGDVTFIAHSTTQATNALLEGDVVPVGIVSLGRGIEGAKVSRDSRIGPLELAPGHSLQCLHRYIAVGDAVSKPQVDQAVRQLAAQGAKVLIGAAAFSVDDPSYELAVMESARELGLPAAGTFEVSKLYGLRARTRTAVINASILPRMIEAAEMTEKAVASARIAVPLMVMRGDGGVMTLREVQRRPINTLLSGPAASVAGALLYERISDGVFLEVGGTSTDISVIRDGRVITRYAQVGGHHTYVHSVDTRTIGLAGGSMVRVRDRKVVDVGPRSAHIAGFPYAAFSAADTETISRARVIGVKPRPEDTPDYLALELENGNRIALTLTDASNALGLVKPGDYAYGSPDAARTAFETAGRCLGVDGMELAKQVIDAAVLKAQGTVEEVVCDYKLDLRTVALVGGGGGATALVPALATRMGLEYTITHKAEVISAIGVALALLRDVVERTIPSPTSEEILSVRNEARESLLSMGAKPDTIEVHIEIDQQASKVRAVATGSMELVSQDVAKACVSTAERRAAAAASLNERPEDVKLVCDNGRLAVFAAVQRDRRFMGLVTSTRQAVRVVDVHGAIVLKESDALVDWAPARDAQQLMERVMNALCRYTEGGKIVPGMYVLAGARVVNMTKLHTEDQIAAVVCMELEGVEPEQTVIVIGAKR